MKRDYKKRIYRLIRIITEIKAQPRQTRDQLLEKFGISKTQLHNDMNLLKELGFEFEYSRKSKRYVITKEGGLPAANLTLSERLSLIMAFRQLSAAGDFILSYEGFNAAKKLSAELPAPFREALFDDVVLKEGFGCKRQVMEMLQEAIEKQQRVLLMYQRPQEKAPLPHEAEPYHLFFRRRALYMEGYSWTEKGIRMYRLNRIEKVEFMPCGFTEIRSDYDFGKRHKNAFSAFPGETTQHVRVRFSPLVRMFIRESLWHHSQQITEQADGSLIFEAEVAYPREVMWWAFRWGADAEILEPEWLRKEAKETVRKMKEIYKI